MGGGYLQMRTLALVVMKAAELWCIYHGHLVTEWVTGQGPVMQRANSLRRVRFASNCKSMPCERSPQHLMH